MITCFESKRIGFRPLEEADIDLAVAQWTDPEVVQYVGNTTLTKEELIKEMPLVTRRCGGGCIGIWVMTDLLTNDKVGSVFLLPMPVELDDTEWSLVQGLAIPDGEIEIGCILKKSAWGKGYATEGCKRLLRFAFEKTPLEQVVAVIDPQNTASACVLRKSGFSETGPVRAYGEDLSGFQFTKRNWLTL